MVRGRLLPPSKLETIIAKHWEEISMRFMVKYACMAAAAVAVLAAPASADVKVKLQKSRGALFTPWRWYRFRTAPAAWR